jgi:hypothetical protein
VKTKIGKAINSDGLKRKKEKDGRGKRKRIVKKAE